MKTVIVMPAYNAAETIEGVFERVPKAAYKRISKFIVVNDGSTDDTKLVVTKRLMKKYRNKILLLNHESNRGYGGAQKTGFSKALQSGADIAVLLHSDGQYAPELLLDMIEPIEKGMADVVIGSRILGGKALEGGMPLHKYVGNRILTMVENVCYGMSISEYHTGYIAYSRKALDSIPFNKLSNTFHFDGEMIMMAGKKNLRLVELPIPTRYAGERSHLDPIRYGIDVFSIIIKNALGGYDF